MFICLVVVVVPEHLSYPAELWGEGQSIGFFVRKGSELEEAIYINYKHRQKCWEGWLLFSLFLLILFRGERGNLLDFLFEKRVNWKRPFT